MMDWSSHVLFDLFPTGGLPAWLHSGRWNTHSWIGLGRPQFVPKPEHTALHRRLRKIEKAFKPLTSAKYPAAAAAAQQVQSSCGC